MRYALGFNLYALSICFMLYALCLMPKKELKQICG
jgi:hypothetical protein